MKPYFTKYLPVEGEIKEGDLVIDVYTHLEPRIYEADTSCIEEKCKKVKLFLCSKDIQVGDKVKWIDDINSEDTIVSETMYHWWTNNGVDKKRKFYKVLGEISPDATWVKEGDEFDKGEIAYRWSEEDQHDTFVYIHEWVDFLKENGYKKIPDYLKCPEVSIQCPHCKTFI